MPSGPDDHTYDGNSLRCGGPPAAVSAPIPHLAEMVAMGRYEALGAELGRLTDEKNAAYGNSFARCGEFLRLLYPDGLRPDQYVDALAVVRVFDKLSRLAHRRDAFGESPWKDIVGYALLGAAEDD